MATASRPRVASADRRQQILAVASDLFARHGYRGTTTREIAQAARMNEALLFRHFASKEDLYWAVIEGHCQRGRKHDDLENKLKAGLSDLELFTGIAEDILRRNQKDPRLTRLLLYSGLEEHRLSQRFFRTYVARYYETMAAHIRLRIEQGRFRDLDPLLAARGFIGMVFHYYLVQEIFGAKRYQKFRAEEVASTLAQIWLQGMICSEGMPKSRGAHKNETRPRLAISKNGNGNHQY
jgi:AcrR family transcriptional regulator